MIRTVVVQLWRGLNLTVRFGLELAALTALGYGGWHVPGPLWVRLLAAIAFPAAGIAVWAQWVAPHARRPIPDPLRLIPEWVVFGGATVALLVTGRTWQAVLLAVPAAGNRLALHLLGTTTEGRSEGDRGTPSPV
ncbi:YrdB family protein [Couchioplanes caeruleus]|uniref:YrdB family protein n=1 Tax=Couchioplanes caeruleus TaxID=56438 RepID=UPI0020BEAE9D|nr:YrdB family protein [Couchioplanes caeruleus]UQU66370.1 YrdB family protein [Couchioplanes caeruleus]